MPRTKGAYQKRSFLDTMLGRLIFLVEPIIFNILCPKQIDGYAPDINTVLRMCSASDNESFKTKRFQSYVDEYVKNGLKVHRKKPITKEIIEHYEKIRNRRIIRFFK
jgi:hypothetical protein|tara:strand:- start:14874 stop:15194 length:321 start_codon:yes stop_codon:yes gene_type:complete